MSGDLLLLIGAVGLGSLVVVVGMRRDLSETTRSNLPRFDSESTAPEGLWEGERRGGPKPLSPRQARWLALGYLLLGLGSLTVAALSDDGLFDAVLGVLFLLTAVRIWQRKWPYASVAAASRSGGAADT